MAIKDTFKKIQATLRGQQIPRDGRQVQNNAGGFVYQVTPWTQLDRFLILGSEGGSYYVGEQALTLENATNLVTCLDEDGARVVARIVEISEAGRAVRQDPAIFALACALKLADLETRRAAAEAVPRVCRTASHLFMLAEQIKGFGGWGRVTTRAFASWYASKSDGQLAYQLIKYRQRHGWTHRDLLLKAHVKPQTPARDALYGWAAQGWEHARGGEQPAAVMTDEGDPMAQIAAFEEIRRVDQADRAAQLVRDHALPWECVPSELLGAPEVWEALLERMPMGAMLRNLARMTTNGLLTGNGAAVATVCERLRDPERIRGARLHPLQVLNALGVYGKGRGVRGNLEWAPVKQVVDALDAAFYLAFEELAPMGQRVMFAIDVSGSMTIGSCAGLVGLSPREASAAMAMALARTEERYHMVGFCGELVPLEIGRGMRLDRVLQTMDGLPFGATDCALPMVWAKEQGLDVDLFVVLTDNETWYGQVHPSQALVDYRAARVPGARLMVCAMTPTRFSIADPQDPGMLDVAGADANLPRLMREFALGQLGG